MGIRIIALILITLLTLSEIFLFGCAAQRILPEELVGLWDHDGCIYEYRKDGIIICGGKRYTVESAGDGLIHVWIDNELKEFDYFVDDEGILMMNGVKFFPVK